MRGDNEDEREGPRPSSKPSVVQPARDQILSAEADIQAVLGDRPLDLTSMAAISNIYRAAAAVRRRAERTVLREAGLSWGGFTALWVLWVWGEMETAALAASCDLSKGTLTGVVGTLEKQGLVERARLDADRRRVNVALTAAGLDTIEELFPRFNRLEGEMTDGLTDADKQALAAHLRLVILNADDM